jgi:hypothetical protein
MVLSDIFSFLSALLSSELEKDDSCLCLGDLLVSSELAMILVIFKLCPLFVSNSALSSLIGITFLTSGSLLKLLESLGVKVAFPFSIFSQI